MSTLPIPMKLTIAPLLDLVESHQAKDDTDRLPDVVLRSRLKGKADDYLQSEKSFTWQCFLLEEEDVNGTIIKSIPMLMIDKRFEKLFEGTYIEDITEDVSKYVFNNIIGFDNFFFSPVIIIRDTNGDVVDLVKYRPQKEGYENLPKYLQEKSINKPEGRGKNFLYPFQIEMERLIKKEGFVFIGEGLKNAVNALIRSVPYISIESTSNVKNDKLIAYVNKLFQDGVVVYGAMDGDAAGEKAFNAISNKLAFSIENLLDFESGLDFTDYLRKEQL